MIQNLEELEKLLILAKAHGVRKLKTSSVEFELDPEPPKAFEHLPDVKITDEEILMNPYAGME